MISSDEEDELSLLGHDDVNIPSLTDTIKGLRSRKGPKTYETKLEEKEYLDTEEQEELIADLRSQALLLDSVWRYLLLAFGFILSGLIMFFMMIHIIKGKETIYFHRILEPDVGRGMLLVLQLLSLVAYICTLLYAYQIPRPKEDHFLLALVSTIVSSSLFIIILAIYKHANISTLWLPVSNIIFFAACYYACYTSLSFEKDVQELAKSKYRYRSI